MKPNLTELKGGIESSSIVEDFCIPFKIMGRHYPTRQKIRKEPKDLSHTRNQLGTTDTCRAPYPTTVEYTLFSSVHGIFCNTDHMSGYKLNISTVKKISFREFPSWLSS